MRPRQIQLHIEELVLHGFASSDRYRIAQAVERELERLFAGQGVSPSFAPRIEGAQIDAGAFNVTAGSKAEAIGVQVAQAVYGGLK